MTEKGKAKRHAILRDLVKELGGTSISDTIEIAKRKYTLSTIDSGAEDWVTEKSPGPTLAQQVLSTYAPRVAAALTAIDDVPVEQLFTLPDDLDAGTKEKLLSSPEIMQFWRREETLTFVRQLPPEIVTKLHGFYAVLDERRAAAIKALGPLSMRTPSGS